MREADIIYYYVGRRRRKLICSCIEKQRAVIILIGNVWFKGNQDEAEDVDLILSEYETSY